MLQNRNVTRLVVVSLVLLMTVNNFMFTV